MPFKSRWIPHQESQRKLLKTEKGTGCPFVATKSGVYISDFDISFWFHQVSLLVSQQHSSWHLIKCQVNATDNEN